MAFRTREINFGDSEPGRGNAEAIPDELRQALNRDPSSLRLPLVTQSPFQVEWEEPAHPYAASSAAEEFDRLEADRLEKLTQLELQRAHFMLVQHQQNDKKSSAKSHNSQQSLEEIDTPDAEEDDTISYFQARDRYIHDLSKRSVRNKTPEGALRHSQSMLVPSKDIGFSSSTFSHSHTSHDYDTEYDPLDADDSEDDNSIPSRPASQRKISHNSCDNTLRARRTTGTPLKTIQTNTMNVYPAQDESYLDMQEDETGLRTAPLQNDSREDSSGMRNRSQSESALYSTYQLPLRQTFEQSPQSIQEVDVVTSQARDRSNSALIEPAKVKSQVADLVIAVVGPRGTGKSTIIGAVLRKAQKPKIIQDHGQNQVQSYRTTTKLGGRINTVQILEVDSALLAFDKHGLLWPEWLPAIDGAMLCYDATDASSVPVLKRQLHAFWIRGGIKLVILACKSNPKASLNKANPIEVAHSAVPFRAGLVQLDGGAADPDRKMRRSFKYVCHMIAESRGQINEDDDKPRKHRDRGSDAAIAEQTENESPTSSPTHPLMGSSTLADSPTYTVRSPVSTLQSPASITSSMQSPVLALRTPEADLYFSPEDLIDKLLLSAVAENDRTFVTAFCIVYRRFTRPFDVLSSVVARFDAIGERLDSNPLLTQYAQIKLVTLLREWLSLYPSDFRSAPTFNLLSTFLNRTVLMPWLTHLCDSLEELKAVANTFDFFEGSWSLPDKEEAPILSRNMSYAYSVDSLGSSLSPESPTTPLSPAFSSHRGSRKSDLMSRLSATRRPRGLSDAETTDTGSSGEQYRVRNYPGATRKPSVEDPLLAASTKLSSMSETDIAVQITRLTWDIFKQMRPRDLIRHVLAPSDLSKPGTLSAKLSDPISQSIAFVNFLSNWTASIILAQPKARWRSFMVEKIIGVAVNLRDMDNLDALMGILAGLNAQPVYRLDSEFAALKTKPIYKKFRSLNRLMATSKGFAAYRMALSSAKNELIPYLGCHLQDLTRILETKDDNQNGRVNWTKQLQIAQATLVVANCGKCAPDLPVDTAIEKLILDVPVHNLEDDTLYNTSYSYRARQPKSNRLRKFIDQIKEG